MVAIAITFIILNIATATSHTPLAIYCLYIATAQQRIIASAHSKKRSFRRLATQALRDMIIYERTCAKQDEKVCIALPNTSIQN